MRRRNQNGRGGHRDAYAKCRPVLHHWLYHHAVRSPFDLQRRVRVFFIVHLVRSVENLLFDRSLGLNVLVGRVSQVAGGGQLGA